MYFIIINSGHTDPLHQKWLCRFIITTNKENFNKSCVLHLQTSNSYSNVEKQVYFVSFQTAVDVVEIFLQVLSLHLLLFKK